MALVALAMSMVDAIAVGFVFLLCVGAYQELSRVRSLTASASGMRVPTRLITGDDLPIQLDLPPRAFLLYLSYGCGGCVQICDRLREVDLGDWKLVVVLSGRPIKFGKDEYRPLDWPSDGGVRVPAGAQVHHDPERKWMKLLGITATPTVIALVGSKVVDQRISPAMDWFKDVPAARRRRADELLSA